MSEQTPAPQGREYFKQLAAERAVEFIESGMFVGLGTGSTAIYATRRIGQLLADGRLEKISGVATSERTRAEAERLGIPLMSDDIPHVLDVAIDGADEIDPDMNLIKGGGGALLREKIVAEASKRFVIVADDAKRSPKLGVNWAVPIEVLAFGWRSQARYLESLGAHYTLRAGADGEPYRTDSGNFILDCSFGPIDDPADLAARIVARAGIVEHGLFIDQATDLILAGADGIEHIVRSKG
jgi:ribose 5-phosphate isomerase A